MPSFMRSRKQGGGSNGSYIIKALESRALTNRPLSVRMADMLVSGFGTATFFLWSFGITVVWIAVNSGWVPGFTPVDPYPFIFLTMVASVGAIFMTIIILISQNRQAAINTLRSELLLQMMIISEKEVTRVLRLVAARVHNGRSRKRIDQELYEMLKDTDVSGIEKELIKQLSAKQ